MYLVSYLISHYFILLTPTTFKNLLADCNPHQLYKAPIKALKQVAISLCLINPALFFLILLPIILFLILSYYINFLISKKYL